MRTCQWERAEVMTEHQILAPALLSVTLLTVSVELSLMRVRRAVAVDAYPWFGPGIGGRAFSMAASADHIAMRPCEGEFGITLVIEFDALPAGLIVAAGAIVAVSLAVDIIGDVAIDAGGGQAQGQIFAMTGATSHFSMPTAQWEVSPPRVIVVNLVP